jgi:hypothetical protein
VLNNYLQLKTRHPMKLLFNLFVRLFLAFLVAKFILSLLGGGSPATLLGLALGLVGLTYLVRFLETYYQRTWQSKMAELGWRLARFFIGLNQLDHRK